MEIETNSKLKYQNLKLIVWNIFILNIYVCFGFRLPMPRMAGLRAGRCFEFRVY